MKSFIQNHTKYNMYHLHTVILNAQTKGGTFGVCLSLSIRTKNKGKRQKSNMV